MSNVLSQEEIDALLNGNGEEEEKEEQVAEDALTDLEKDALGEMANISMGAAATALSSLLGHKVEITTPSVEMTTIKKLKDNYPKPYVIVDVNYNAGLQGSNILIIHTYDAGVIVDLMMGGDGSNPPMELSDLHMSAVSEAMNQMMGSSCTSLSQLLDKMIDISPPGLDLFELSEHEMFGNDEQIIVKISFRMVIQGLIDSEMMQLLPIPFAKNMVNDIMNSHDSSKYEPQPKQQQAAPQPPQQTPPSTNAVPVAPAKAAPPTVPQSVSQVNVPNNSGKEHNVEAFTMEKETTGKVTKDQQVAVSPVQFASFQQEEPHVSMPTNIDLLMDVGLQISVELGRTVKKIKEILDFSVGTVIELDKLAGEPVDILVNGKMLAKGEVVVIDENFGVRITEIVSPAERVKNLNN